MTKKTLLTTFIAIAIMILTGGNRAMAYNFTEVYQGQTIYYSYVTTQYGSEVKVTYKDTDYNTYSGNIVIPTTATNLDLATPKTYNVTQIDANAFKNSTGLTGVTIASSITKIGSYAFQGCTSLTEITIPSNVTSFDNSATSMFADCTNLVTVVNNSSTTSIQSSMFNGCSKLENISIPSGITTFGYNCFYGCTSIANITYNATNCGNMTSSPFSVSKAETLDVTIGENVETIPNSLFYLVSNLKSIIIPNSVTSIGNNSFRGTGLTSLTIGNHVSSIGENAFYGCTGLTSLSLPSTLQTIGNYAFQNCSGLTSITIPSSVTSLGYNAFRSCTGLKKINYNVTTHSDFSSSNKPFYGCGATNTEVTLTIGANVTRIPAYAFNGAITAGTLVIPASVTSIGTKAFANNGGNYTSLSTVYMLRIKTDTDNPTSIDANDVFKTGYSSYSTIKVLYSSGHSILTAYQNAENWSTFMSSISETDNVTIANMELTTGSLTIPAGNTIMVTGTLTNTDASHLVIEDGGQLICNNDVNATLQKEITKAENWGEGDYTADAWYFIASPVDGFSTTTIATGTANSDLFSYNEPTSEWWNAQNTATGNHGFNTLTRGQGYLYANNTGDDLAFMGEMPATNSNIEKDLSYVGSGSAQGFNLMGNPFTCNLTNTMVKIKNADESLTAITSYYTVENGTELSLVEDFSKNPIKPGRGFLIQATAANQKLVFNPSGSKQQEASAKPSFITIEAGNEQFMDRACIQIGNGNTLRKMTINDQVSHVYVMHDGKDYAAATIAEAQGEMPVNFKANENGQYTLTVNTENVEMNYLHLIDNMTGADIDLLLTPSYTFNAKTYDYESRFRLVFAANEGASTGSATDATFAYMSDGNLIINAGPSTPSTGSGTEGSGTLILQVIDVLGHQLLTKELQTSYFQLPTSSLPAGVYVLRLVNGNNTKTQKIVVR